MAITDISERVKNTYSSKFKAFTDVGNALSDVVLCAENKQIPFMITGAKISIIKGNEIKSTSLINRRGSVKELIQAKDYTVKISGTLIGLPNLFPYAELALLNNMLSEQASILVASPYLAVFGIFRLAFKDCTFDQGNTINTLPFTLTFESDYTSEFNLLG